MSGSVNKVILVGNVGKDPEVRQSGNGQKIVSFSLATSDSWKDKSGEKQEKTEWHRVVIFNQGLAEIVERYVKKGSKLYLEGSLQTRKWTDQSGAEKYTTEIVLGNYRGEMTLLDSKDKTDTPAAPRFTPAEYSAVKNGEMPPPSSFNDDIPF